MRTFKLVFGLDLKAVVPQRFTDDMRMAAQAPDATTFLANAQALFPDRVQDEEFTMHIVKHGIRRRIRESLVDLFTESGLGCTLSPASVELIEVPVPAEPDASPVLAADIDSALGLPTEELG